MDLVVKVDKICEPMGRFSRDIKTMKKESNGNARTEK